jgi:hypothetical protein
LFKEHAARKEFSGHIQIVVVLGMTPSGARKAIPNLLEHLRGICNEASRGQERRYRVSLTYQKGWSQSTTNASDAVAMPAAVAADVAPEAPKSRRTWMRPTRWVMVLGGAALAYFASNRQHSVHAYPDAIVYGRAQLSQATTWNRSGASGVVYLPAGEALPAASLQVGIIVSTEHPTANELLAWIREQSRASGEQRVHDSGTNSERCVVGLNMRTRGPRTFMALQVCKTGKSRAVCIESDRVLDDGALASCLNSPKGCDDVCSRRWLDGREDLDLVLAAFLDRG